MRSIYAAVIIGIIAASLASAGDRYKHFSRFTEPLPSGHADGASGRSEPVPEHVVRVYTSRNCAPCSLLERHAKEGRFGSIQMQFISPAPQWVTVFPTIHFPGSDGKWRQINGYGGDYNEVVSTITKWGASAVKSHAAGASPIEQFSRFAGSSGTFVFTPATPIQAVMDDGTKISYSRISGSYKVVNGIPSCTFDQPFPRVDTRKFFLHFGASIQSAEFVPPSSVAVGTNRGKYTIRMEAAK